MKKAAVHLTRAARDACADPGKLRRAAEAALAKQPAAGDVEFLRFAAEGRHYALSARLVIEVDLFPNRVPDRVIRR